MRPAREVKATVGRASALLGARSTPKGAPRWCFAELAGRLVEVSSTSANGGYSAALALIADAQLQGETAAWVGPRWHGFFPPDVHAAGVDLEALPIVRVERAKDLPIAADVLVRSGGFGVVVLDVGSVRVPLGVLSRFAGLAREHEALVLFLTEKPEEHPSLGSVVSLRASASLARRDEGVFAYQLAIHRDRLRSSSWVQIEERRAPPGLS